MMSFARLPAPLMIIGLIVAAPAVGQTAAAPAPAPVAPVASPLAGIPGVVVQYYDVSGTTTEALRASIEVQRPKDPATGHALPASVKWSIGTSLKKQTTGTACKIIGATASLKGEVVLPRLVSTEGVPAPVLAAWQNYVASLETQQAAALRAIATRLPEVERAILASTCEGARDAANKAIDVISKPVAQPPVPAPAAAPATPTG